MPDAKPGGDADPAESDDRSDGDASRPDGESVPDAVADTAREHADAFEEARREAQRTLTAQSDMVARMDRKAIRLLRFTATLLMLIASAVSTVVGSDLAPAALFNGYVVGSLAFLLAAAACAGVCYTLTNQYDGIGASGIDETVADGYSTAEFRERLLLGYADWIRRNRTTNARKTPLVTGALLCVVAGGACFLLGLVRAFAGPLPPWVPGVVAVALLAVALASRLHKQIREWYVLSTRDPTHTGEAADLSGFAFRGEPVSTGDVGDDDEWFGDDE